MSLIDMTDEEFKAYQKEKGVQAIMQEFEDEGIELELSPEVLDSINGGGIFCKVCDLYNGKTICRMELC